MFFEALLISVVVFFLGAAISFLEAALIRGIFIAINFRKQLQTKFKHEWKGATLTSKF